MWLLVRPGPVKHQKPRDVGFLVVLEDYACGRNLYSSDLDGYLIARCGLVASFFDMRNECQRWASGDPAITESREFVANESVLGVDRILFALRCELVEWDQCPKVPSSPVVRDGDGRFHEFAIAPEP